MKILVISNIRADMSQSYNTDDSRSSCNLICATQAHVQQDQLKHEVLKVWIVAWFQGNQELYKTQISEWDKVKYLTTRYITSARKPTNCMKVAIFR